MMAGLQPAVDCHAHCFDLRRQKLNAASAYEVHDHELGSSEDYQAVLDAHGISHAVLVNPLGGYGTDNSYLLHVISTAGGRFRGIALLAEDADQREVERLVEGGIAGIRFNLNFPDSPSLFGDPGRRSLDIARAAGWIVQVHYSGETIIPALPLLRASGCTVVIDHFGRPDVHGGITRRDFAELCAFGREGSAIVKLSSLFRMSCEGPPYADCRPYAEALIEAFTLDRCIWGSDWPFTRAKRRVDYGPQLAFLRDLLPADDQRRVLWETPSRLFGFTSP